MSVPTSGQGTARRLCRFRRVREEGPLSRRPWSGGRGVPGCGRGSRNSFGLINTGPRRPPQRLLSPDRATTGRLGLFAQSGRLGIAVRPRRPGRRLGISSASAGNPRGCVRQRRDAVLDRRRGHGGGRSLPGVDGQSAQFSRIARHLALTNPSSSSSPARSRRQVPGHRCGTRTLSPKSSTRCSARPVSSVENPPPASSTSPRSSSTSPRPRAIGSPSSPTRMPSALSLPRPARGLGPGRHPRPGGPALGGERRGLPGRARRRLRRPLWTPSRLLRAPTQTIDEDVATRCARSPPRVTRPVRPPSSGCVVSTTAPRRSGEPEVRVRVQRGRFPSPLPGGCCPALAAATNTASGGPVTGHTVAPTDINRRVAEDVVRDGPVESTRPGDGSPRTRPQRPGRLRDSRLASGPREIGRGSARGSRRRGLPGGAQGPPPRRCVTQVAPPACASTCRMPRPSAPPGHP